MVTPPDASEESGGMKDVVKLQDMGTEVYLIGAVQMIGVSYTRKHIEDFLNMMKAIAWIFVDPALYYTIFRDEH